MGLKLLHLNASRSFRVVWTAAEIGLRDLEVVRIDRPVGGSAPAGFVQKLSDDPRIGLAKAPALIDSDGDIVILESGAIVQVASACARLGLTRQYLAERYGDGKILPPVTDYKARATVLQWLHFAESTLM